LKKSQDLMQTYSLFLALDSFHCFSGWFFRRKVNHVIKQGSATRGPDPTRQTKSSGLQPLYKL